MKKIGLVGGISWVSTLDYYKLINEGVNLRMGGLHFAWQARRAGLGEDDVADDLPPEAEVLQGSDDAAEAPVPDIDADALADMVRDLLREELQGALGERMTRNIRKMVRAEVARIFATRDLA